MTEQAQAIGPLPPLSADARRMYRGGIWFVIMAETMIFVTVFSTRFLLAGTERVLEPSDPVGVLISLALIISLIPAWLAKRTIAAGDAPAMARHLLITAALGAVALVVIVYDWVTLAFPVGSPFGENYVISTGYHAVHILIGAIWLFAAAIAGGKGVYTRDNHWVVDGGVLFWTFIVLMWVLLYVIFFVV